MALVQETVEEEEVLRRLGTGEKAGLTAEEAARRLRVHGPNVVSRSHQVRAHSLSPSLSTTLITEQIQAAFRFDLT
jgi:hypothetical protein